MTRALAVLLLVLVQEDRLVPLARNLESSDLRKVYRAVGDLAALGEAALPALESRAKDAQGRTRDYLRLAADEIRSAALLNGVPVAKRISIKASDRNVTELLGDLRARTGIALALENLLADNEKLPEVPVDIQDATPLEAFDAICKAANVSIMMENGQFGLYPGDYQETPRFFYDHYFFRLGGFVLMKTADFRRPAVQNFVVRMELLWDPVAAPCRFAAPVIVEAVDEKGKNLLPPPAKKDDEEEPQDAGPSSELHLVPPSPGAEKIAALRGFVKVGLPRKRVTLTFGGKDALEGQVRKAEGYTAKVAEHEPLQFRLVLDLTSGSTKPEDLQLLPFQAVVTLKGGEATRCYLNTNVTEDACQVHINYQPLHLREALVDGDRPVPAAAVEKIELSIITAVQERKIPFEFRDVKLK